MVEVFIERKPLLHLLLLRSNLLHLLSDRLQHRSLVGTLVLDPLDEVRVDELGTTRCQFVLHFQFEDDVREVVALVDAQLQEEEDETDCVERQTRVVRLQQTVVLRDRR